MNKLKDWEPVSYLRFNQERTQPSRDLVSRISIINPLKIIDIGCGPGNSTHILKERWPASIIMGLDNSQAMIEKAQADYPEITWIIADAGKLKIKEKFDVVFSNATIQWIPNHEKLITEFFSLVTDHGVLAVQIPDYFNMAFSQIIDMVAAFSRWKDQLADCNKIYTFHDAGFYFDTLTKLTNTFEIWQTSYFHSMNSHQDIIEMMKPTGMKPFLDRLDSDNEKNEFEKAVLNEVIKAYPARENGKVLYPFPRIFFTAAKG